MAHTLTEIAQQLKDNKKKVQLVYGFNSSGKTSLSKEFKRLISPGDGEGDKSNRSRNKILYYNAFTEDLFYWENDPDPDATPKLKIQTNSFTNWILNAQGKGPDIVKNFQYYTTNKITPIFNEEYEIERVDGKREIVEENSEVTFRLDLIGTLTKEPDLYSTERYELVKISRSEESNFIWSVFFTMIKHVVFVLNEPERDDSGFVQFRDIEYILIDDPVSSLDENHLIELAFDLAELVKSSDSPLNFIITTHNPLFLNVLYRELNSDYCYLLENHKDGNFNLLKKKGAANRSFSYHLHLKNILEKAIKDKQVEKYHFMLLRNLYEKTASFLGYPHWREILPEDNDGYLKRILDFSSHSNLSDEEVSELTEREQQTFERLLDNLNSYRFFDEGTNE